MRGSSRVAPDACGPERFGAEEPFALGVEEELLLVGTDNELIDGGGELAGEADPDRGGVSGELFEAMVEGRSDVAPNAAVAAEHLRQVRHELLSSSRLMGAGVHPNAAPGATAVQQTRRYALIEASLQGVLRTPICGQHTHVGLPDKETAIHAYNGIRTHVPLLNALAANSPFWFGEDSGLASSRTVIFRSYPRAAMAPAFTDYADFERVTRQVCRAGDLDDYTEIWWDVRMHPQLGTIEIRAADTQFDLARVAALSALVHCLVRVEAERDQSEIPSREALAESSFQATRYGLDATLLDRDCERVQARDLAKHAVEAAGEAAREFGCEAELAGVEAILEEGSGAEVQRRIYNERGMSGLLAFLVARTAAY